MSTMEILTVSKQFLHLGIKNSEKSKGLSIATQCAKAPTLNEFNRYFELLKADVGVDKADKFCM